MSPEGSSMSETATGQIESISATFARLEARVEAGQQLFDLIAPRVDENRCSRRGGQGMTAFSRVRMEALAVAVDAWRAAGGKDWK